MPCSRNTEIDDTTAIKNLFMKCGFSYDHVSSNDDTAVKLKEDQEDDLHILQPLGVQYGATVCVTELMRFAESRVPARC